MTAVHSPFVIVEEFISPLLCESFIDYLNITTPDVDKDGIPVSSTRTNDRIQEIVYERIISIVPQLETHYNVKYKGTLPIEVEWYPEGCSGRAMGAENSRFVRGKWLRTLPRDLTGVIFMSDYQDNVPFSNDFEVYGGKLEFPQHQFGFNPQRGSLIVFPSDPHFINGTTRPLVGDLFQIRFHLSTQTPFIYQPRDFPGNFRSWF